MANEEWNCLDANAGVPGLRRPLSAPPGFSEVRDQIISYEEGSEPVCKGGKKHFKTVGGFVGTLFRNAA